METYYVYMMANKHNNVLNIGVTNNLIRRVHEHKKGMIDGFTKKYNCHKLVWFQQTDDVTAALIQEKRIKKMEAGI